MARLNDYPGMEITDYGAHDGNAKVQIEYTEHKYRELFEQTEPEFDIVAQGRQAGGDRELSPVSVKVTVKIKFRFCIVDVPVAAQEFDNSANGGTAKDDFILYKLV